MNLKLYEKEHDPNGWMNYLGGKKRTGKIRAWPGIEPWPLRWPDATLYPLIWANQTIFRFFFNCLGCSFNCEDRVPVHINFLSSGSKYDLFHIFQCEICLHCLTSFLQHATCMCFRRQTVCRPNSSEINAKNKLFKTNKQTTTTN